MNKIKQVLLVDDNDTTNFYNEDVLEETGFFEEIKVFSNGQSVVDYFQSLKDGGLPLPELMFLDIKMPDYDGFEVLEELEQMLEDDMDDLKIFMLTTSSHKRDLEKFAKFVNAVEYVNKPLELDWLKGIIKHYF